MESKTILPNELKQNILKIEQKQLLAKKISNKDYNSFIKNPKLKNSPSFLQLPSWGKVKIDWNLTLIGFFDASGKTSELLGVTSCLLRKLPKFNKYFAYIPEGPIFLNELLYSSNFLPSLEKLLKLENCFAVTVGFPVWQKKWENKKVKDALANDSINSLDQLEPCCINDFAITAIKNLTNNDWQLEGSNTNKKGSFAIGQPECVFYLPLTKTTQNNGSVILNEQQINENSKITQTKASAALTEEELSSGFNQLWRRNIKKAIKLGVQVEISSVVDFEKLEIFHKLYLETAKRDNFIPRPINYFSRLFENLSNEAKLFVAYYNNEPIASTIYIQVDNHAWYAYGATSSKYREARGSNLIQWEMIKYALANKAKIYDLRGITKTLDKNDPLCGLIQFKLGTGGNCLQYIGEWSKPLNKFYYNMFLFAMKLRSLVSSFKKKLH